MVEVLHNQEAAHVTEAFQGFLKEGYRNTLLYHTRSEEAGSKLEHLIEQASELYTHVNRLGEYRHTQAFEQLTRLLREQCIETEEGVRIAIEGNALKPNGLQNPSDPDATYRNKGGKGHTGYVTNVVEVRDMEKNLGLILEFDVQPNTHSDAEFGETFVQESPLSNEIDVLAMDGAYYREETVKAAESKNIELNFSNMTGRKAKIDQVPVTQFEIDDEHVITCGVRGGDMSSRYLEVYSFQYSAKYFSFAKDESDYKNKVLRDTIKVSVVLDLKWVDMTSNF